MKLRIGYGAARTRRAGVAAVVAVGALSGLGVLGGVAAASSVTTASFSGGTGTVSSGGTLYAKQGGALTLTVTTSSDTRCVDVSGAFTGHQTSTTARSSWSFSFTAPAGNGAQGVTAAASPNVNTQGNCTGPTGTSTASYTLDNAGPVLTAALSPAANAAGWNRTDTTLTWSATDAGSGVGSGPTPAGATHTANGIFTDTSTATDRLGNATTSSATVRVDKAAPTISATQTGNGDGTTTVTFACSDSQSGGQNPSGITSCAADGTSPASSSVTVPAAGGTVSGTATDVAGNTSKTTVTVAASDGTPPTITHVVSPAPNAAGWNSADATVTFGCADNIGGSGIASCVADGTGSASRTVGTETNGTVVSGTATDKAGNKATDSVTVKLDKTPPTATVSRSPLANANGWNNTDVVVTFGCTDGATALSGVRSCPAPVTLSGEGAGQSASGTATDNAGNTSAPASVTGVNIDKTPPSLSGAPTTAPNAAGWYRDDVTIAWSASDARSGLAGPVPANSTITGEGSGLKTSASVADRAGNTASADSAAVNVDRTAPTTGVGGVSNSWVNGSVAVTLAAADNLSGVASTTYIVDGGAPQHGTGFTLSTEGDHTVTFFSTDKAGNTEDTHTAHIRIDKTAPTIAHSFTPAGYTDGAWINADVTVTFDCADAGGSGVADCTAPVTKGTEGADQQVVGTATDNAGNSATDTAVVSIDKTKPTITAQVDRAPNAAGWYGDDVIVTYTASDALSGVSGTPAPDVLHEGANQSAGATVTDAAGNSATSGVSGIDVDTTPPVLTGTSAGGWHTGDVVVHWSCTDALSGPAGQPADTTVTGEGANLSATASCTDLAGNTATETVGGIRIDRTAPATGISVSGPLGNGWYTAGTTVALIASDNLSGVAATYFSIDGGAAQLYSSAVSVAADGTHTVTWWSTDIAGNVEDKGGNSVTLKVDKTPPALTGAPTGAPNGNGWYSGDVTVHWTCSDATSGLDGSCPADSTVTGEGDDLSASASVRDNAGNATDAAVDGIRIDRTAPTTTADVPDAPDSGWYTGAVRVTLTGHDALSGAAGTAYSVDGGAAKAYTGAFSFDTEGTHTIAFHSTDEAGNVETAGAPLTLRIDTTAPTTTAVNPISPASGWFVTNGIPFAFDAADGGSGVAATYYTIDGGAPQTYGAPFTADLSTGSHTATYWSVDVAGNAEAKRSLTLKVDSVPPTITGDTVKADGSHRAPNANGWFNSDVDVKFTCTDADSGVDGIAGCAGDTTLTNDGAGQTVHGDAIDVAGNRSSTDVGPVNIDQTKPTLSGAPTTDANADGWYKGNVVVAWTGVDKLSGIDTSTQPNASTITGEGRSLGAGPVTIADKAGNVSDPVTVGGIKIDRTPLVVAGTPTASPNAAGWYRDSVTVDYTCTDPKLADGTDGSGVASCPTSKTVKGDGANQSVTGDTATDQAGNTTPGRTVGGINIDGTPPATASNNQCTQTNGFCTGSTANVVLTATDQAGLSGVKEIHYRVDGGTEQVAAGATRTVPVALDGSGAGTVTYWAVDNAGNVETANSVSLKWDNIAPTVTHTLTPKPNADDWNNGNVTVTFSAKDDDSGSGVASVSSPVTVSTETAGQTVTGTATDTAGNKGTDSVTVKLDRTAPSISGAIVSGTKGSNGWYVGAVTVHFTCADTLSGIAATMCPSDVVVSSNGANQSVTRSVTDRAGNTASATVSGITVDQEKPTITGVNVNGGTYTLGSVPSATCTATDSFAGLASCTVTVTGGNANGVGTFAYTAKATDRAGNTSTATGTYKVIYRFDGFLQPVNDTAHQVGASTSVFKAGSTVPVKFQLRKANGTIVQAVSAPAWVAPVKGSSMSAPVDESAYAATGDSGSDYRWDATAQQYLYNWKTGTGGNYWRIGVTLDDGQTYYVNIGLR